jgi:hypothetical protein
MRRSNVDETMAGGSGTGWGSSRRSFAWRLFLGFGVIAGLTLLAAGMADLSLVQLRSAISSLAEDSLPNTRAALRLAKESAGIAAAAPALAGAGTIDTAQRLRRSLDVKLGIVDNLADTIDPDLSADRIATIHDAILRMRLAVEKLGAVVETRLALVATRNHYIASMSVAHLTALATLAPLIDDAEYALDLGMRSAFVQDNRSQTRTQLATLADGDLAQLATMTQLRADSNLASALLTEAALTPDRDQLVPLRDRFIATSDELRRLLRASDDNAHIVPIQIAIDALLRHGDQDGGLFGLRLRELDAAAQGNSALAETQALSTRLDLDVSGLGRGSKAGDTRRRVDAV